MSIDLYRVGTPSVGETWPGRYSYTRSTGGLGAGVYAFRTQTAAEENATAGSNDKRVYALHDALTSPVQPATLDATDAINRLSRLLALMREEVVHADAEWDDLIERAGSLRVSLSSFGASEPGIGSGQRLTSVGFDILLHTTELREKWGLDEETFIKDAIRATRTAHRRCADKPNRSCSQPINVLLWPDFDGIAPYPDAGGDSGRHGCVIFKQKVDRCAGHETEFSEQVAADELNRCFREVNP